MTMKANLALNLAVNIEGANAFNSGPFWNAAIAIADALSDGTTADKFNRCYIAERTVAASTNDDIDLSGALVDALGDTAVMVEIVALLIYNAPKDASEAANLSTLTVGGATNPVMAAIGPTIPPGGFMMFYGPTAAGVSAVTAGTGDILRIANGAGGTAKYQIAVLGRSA